MIPKSISEISNEWIEELAYNLLKTTKSLKISSLSINTSNCSEELFECCNLSVTFEENQKKQLQWLIKLVPTDPDLRDIVLRHDLFKKELLIHQLVIPELQTFVHTKLGNKNIGTLPHRFHHQEMPSFQIHLKDFQYLNYCTENTTIKVNTELWFLQPLVISAWRIPTSNAFPPRAALKG